MVRNAARIGHFGGLDDLLKVESMLQDVTRERHIQPASGNLPMGSRATNRST
jgi:hypothetical protein